MDAEDVIEADAFAVLNTPAIVALAPVYQHVPQDVAPPVTIIGDMDSDGDFGAKDGRDERVNLSITVLTTGEERRPLRALKALIKAALHDRTVGRDGWTLHYRFVGSDGFLLPEDGETYVGNFRFSVIALSND